MFHGRIIFYKQTTKERPKCLKHQKPAKKPSPEKNGANISANGSEKS
jgi:hypothetical protein